ncbi:ATP-binding cassette domain-containing protein [Flavihumibacter profundi]|uniref:ATP-binding cassette domain-containing protein n=1 Tax=Flavihumibacter profundi TaxID=2716883 RepID=UPI001CC472E2|nr:ATP-binding cassette domain-containing protein [Flavihumibacter profundi]MBZ5859101.1 ATP-binding cassette domain-containing protein [Flavihumibacter profundi]
MTPIASIAQQITLQPGNHLLVTGPSGSGKTLLAKAIAGLPGTGKKIVLVEQHYNFTNRAHVNQFYYQQRFNSIDADDSATVQEELDALDADAAETATLLDIFGMSARRSAALLHLSSGEHKRFQLIKAFGQNPQVLILDEPFTGMDTRSRGLLKDFMAQKAAAGCQFIIICPMAECPSFINQMLSLNKGSISFFGDIEAGKLINVDENPNGSFTAPAHLQPLTAVADTIVQLNDAHIRYGEKVLLESINWTVKNGERWWLKGVNGSGKSTLISLLTGDNPKAYANNLVLFGSKRGSGESIWDIKKQIGFVSPELQWYFDRNQTVFSAVASGLFDTIGLFRQVNETQQELVMGWLEAFGLTAIKGRLLSMLSASEQRLTLLARAMVKNPPLLILDEPCQGLDDHQREAFVKIVDRLCEDPNRTLIYVTHYEQELPYCINKKIELQNGQAICCAYQSQLIPA